MSLNSSFGEELEVLSAIYMDDLSVLKHADSCAELEIILHPNTAEKRDKRYVCLTLNFRLTKNYPDIPPLIHLRSPRGLSDGHIHSIINDLRGLANEKVGDVMLFELIEFAKESLSDNNHPHCICPICLEYFEVNDGFVRLDCYHYFHNGCIHLSVEASQELLCPVCRTPFEADKIPSDVDAAIRIQHEDNPVKYTLSEEYVAWQKLSKEMFERQMRNGGIIDVEHERNKYLVSENEVLEVSPQHVKRNTATNSQVHEMSPRCTSRKSYENVSKESDFKTASNARKEFISNMKSNRNKQSSENAGRHRLSLDAKQNKNTSKTYEERPKLSAQQSSKRALCTKSAKTPPNDSPKPNLAKKPLLRETSNQSSKNASCDKKGGTKPASYSKKIIEDRHINACVANKPRKLQMDSLQKTPLNSQSNSSRELWMHEMRHSIPPLGLENLKI